MHSDIPDTPPPPAPSTVLIVEDSFLIALSLEDDLKQAGFRVAGPAPGVAEAFSALRREKVDAVLLDVDLGGDLSFPIAAYLTLQRIPFAFLTSYPIQEIRRSFPLAEIFEKPVDIGAVIAGLKTLIGPAGVRRPPKPSSSPS